jgi:CheY-specific phosphatase CheX
MPNFFFSKGVVVNPEHVIAIVGLNVRLTGNLILEVSEETKNELVEFLKNSQKSTELRLCQDKEFWASKSS